MDFLSPIHQTVVNERKTPSSPENEKSRYHNQQQQGECEKGEELDQQENVEGEGCGDVVNESSKGDLSGKVEKEQTLEEICKEYTIVKKENPDDEKNDEEGEKENDLIDEVQKKAKQVFEFTDASPEELMGFFGGSGGGEEDNDDGDDSYIGYAKRVAMALLPTPQTVGDFLSPGFEDNSPQPNIGNDAISTGVLDRSARARVLKRKLSFTAKLCSFPGCQSLHYRLDDRCACHASEEEAQVQTNASLEKLKSLAQSMDEQTEMTAEEKQKQKELNNFLKQVELNKKMIDEAEVLYELPSEEVINEAKKLITSIELEEMPDKELGQLLQQFRELDRDADGLITKNDVKALALEVDPQWVNECAQDIDRVTTEWIVNSHYDGRSEMNFPDYVLSLQKIRAFYEDSRFGERAYTLMKTGFWDLRSCVLIRKSNALNGLALKRGYFLVKESLNSYKIRFFRQVEGHILEYWDRDPAVVNNDETAKQRQNAIEVRKAIKESDHIRTSRCSIRSVEGLAEDHDDDDKYGSDSSVSDDEEDGVANINDEEKMETIITEEISIVQDECPEVVDVQEEVETGRGSIRGSQSTKVVPYRDFDDVPEENTATPMKVPVLKGKINLKDVIAIHFSVKTALTPQKEFVDADIDCNNCVVFKVLTCTGRRYTLAAEKDTAVRWMAQLSWYVTANKLARQWQTEWGIQRKYSTTIRDWLNAANVITKIGYLKDLRNKAKKEAEIAEAIAKKCWFQSSKERIRKISRQRFKRKLMKLTITERDVNHLKVCNLTLETAESAGGIVLGMIKAWDLMGDKIVGFDRSVTGGIVSGTIAGLTKAIITSLQVQRYARGVENKMKSNKYNVEWVSSANERICAVCKVVFKSASMRRTLRKHHCRFCGRVVCQACSNQMHFLERTQSLERICDDCVIQDSCQKTQQKPAFVQNHKQTDVVSEAKTPNKNEENFSTNENPLLATHVVI